MIIWNPDTKQDQAADDFIQHSLTSSTIYQYDPESGKLVDILSEDDRKEAWNSVKNNTRIENDKKIHKTPSGFIVSPGREGGAEIGDNAFIISETEKGKFYAVPASSDLTNAYQYLTGLKEVAMRTIETNEETVS